MRACVLALTLNTARGAGRVSSSASFFLAPPPSARGVTEGFRGAGEIHENCVHGWRHAVETLELFTGREGATICSTPDVHPRRQGAVTGVKAEDRVLRFYRNCEKITRDRLTIFSDPV